MRHTARYWHRSLAAATRWLGRYPRMVGVVCGYSMALLVAVALLLVSFQWQLKALERGHMQMVRSIHEVQEDVGGLLDQLNQSFEPVCTPANLEQLRFFLFSYRFVRDIGMLNADQQLFCTSITGLLPKPFASAAGGIDVPIGRTYIQTPLLLAGQRLRATVVERGRFNVVVGLNATHEALAAHADAIWVGSGAQRVAAYQGRRFGVLGASPPAAWAFVLTTPVSGNAITLQSVLLPQDLYLGSGSLLWGSIVLCVLLGFFMTDAVTQRCRHFRSVEHRIRFLCKPAHVVCHYQPIIDLASGRPIGCEVLARLQDGKRLVYPDRFIPALLKNNLAWTFDAAVSAHALRELGPALRGRADFKVALNFFPQNLQRDAIEPHLRVCLDAIGHRDWKIELEVTEYDFAPEIVPELKRLQADGYFISIDDFGTGYSNLGMVKKMAPDFLKIDRSFVHEMDDASLRSSLIPEIVAIARAVGSEVIAEGIEKEAQYTQLRDLGVRYGQGYYFAKPMPLAELVRYLDAK
jgi:sensor c-di-GMP phosphodiesterase-like protein